MGLSLSRQSVMSAAVRTDRFVVRGLVDRQIDPWMHVPKLIAGARAGERKIRWLDVDDLRCRCCLGRRSGCGGRHDDLWVA